MIENDGQTKRTETDQFWGDEVIANSNFARLLFWIGGVLLASLKSSVILGIPRRIQNGVGQQINVSGSVCYQKYKSIIMLIGLALNALPVGSVFSLIRARSGRIRGEFSTAGEQARVTAFLIKANDAVISRPIHVIRSTAITAIVVNTVLLVAFTQMSLDNLGYRMIAASVIISSPHPEVIAVYSRHSKVAESCRKMMSRLEARDRTTWQN